MAFAGAMIVFCGLVGLATAISLFPKLMSFIEARASSRRSETTTPAQPPQYFPADAAEIARIYQPLIDEIGDTFQLKSLYSVSRQKGFPHPHLTISFLRRANFLVPKGQGLFKWNPSLAKAKKV